MSHKGSHKPSSSCEFSPHAITLGAFCQPPPRKIHKTSYKTKILINIGYETPLDIQVGDLYNNKVRDHIYETHVRKRVRVQQRVLFNKSRRDVLIRDV